jgi:hypothetical protein
MSDFGFNESRNADKNIQEKYKDNMGGLSPGKRP